MAAPHDNDAEETKVSSDQPRSTLVGFDSLLEDVIGLNIRSFRSIGVLFAKPVKYFEAAKDANWLWRFTPSFRLWFGITALTAALRFLWAAPDSPSANVYRGAVDGMVDAANLGLEAQGQILILTDAMRDNAASLILKWMMAISPFITIFLISGLALIYKAWGEKLTYVVRLRYLFGIIITGSFAGLCSVFPMMLIPDSIFEQVNFALLLLMFALYFYTAYKGPYRSYDRGARLGFSALITVLLVTIVIFSLILSMSIGIWIAIKQTFPLPVSIAG